MTRCCVRGRCSGRGIGNAGEMQLSSILNVPAMVSRLFPRGNNGDFGVPAHGIRTQFFLNLRSENPALGNFQLRFHRALTALPAQNRLAATIAAELMQSLCQRCSARVPLPSTGSAFYRASSEFPVPGPPQDDRPPMVVAMQWVHQITAVSLQMVLPAALGYWLDWRWGTEPWLALIGAVAGFVVGLRRLLQWANAANRKSGSDGSQRSEK